MFTFIKKILAKRKQKKLQYQEELNFFTELFNDGEILWRRICNLEAHKVYVESYFNGSHTVSGLCLNLKLNWRGFAFELRSIIVNNMFCHEALFNDAANILSKRWKDEAVRHQIWEPRWWKDGVEITGIGRITALTCAMSADLDALMPKTTDVDANKYADDVIRHILSPIAVKDQYKKGDGNLRFDNLELKQKIDPLAEDTQRDLDALTKETMSKTEASLKADGEANRRLAELYGKSNTILKKMKEGEDRMQSMLDKAKRASNFPETAMWTSIKVTETRPAEENPQKEARPSDEEILKKDMEESRALRDCLSTGCNYVARPKDEE